LKKTSSSNQEDDKPLSDRTHLIDVSVIIVNWNTRRLLLDCIASVYGVLRKGSFELIVVDNGSSDDSVEAVLKYYPEVRLIVNPQNYGFAKANNVALKLMRGRYALLLNSDTTLRKGAIDLMLDFMERTPDVGMCGPQLLNADGTKQASFGTFPTILNAFLSKTVVRLLFPGYFKRTAAISQDVGTAPAVVDFMYGACMLVRYETMDDIGLLDEDYFFFYEETDWCYRMKRGGWQVVYIPEAEIYHYGAKSSDHINTRTRIESWRSQYIYFNKNYHLSQQARFFLYVLGFLTVLKNLLEYSILNIILVGSRKRSRMRWIMYSNLFIWHVRGFPESMGLPRSR